MKKTNPRGNRNRRRKISVQSFRKYFQDNERKNYPTLKKEMPGKIKDAQIEWTKKKFLLTHNNHDIKHNQQRKNIKSCKQRFIIHI